jgi:hypothetical protein
MSYFIEKEPEKSIQTFSLRQIKIPGERVKKIILGKKNVDENY